MIRLKCINETCNFIYSVTEKELGDNPQYHRTCMVCGSILKVDNLEEIIEKDIEKQVKEYIDLWFRTLGIEYTIEMVERHKDLAVYRLYKAEIEKRGFKLK
jgi:hypothetical protein